MIQSSERFTHEVTARQYIKLYEKMLKRPLINGEMAGEDIEPSSKIHQIRDEVSFINLEEKAVSNGMK